MSRTSKALRRLSVPVLVTSVVMTGVSSLGLVGVANAANNGGQNGTLTVTASPAYRTIGQNSTITVRYQAGLAANSQLASASPQVITLTASGSAKFTTGPGAGTNTTTCTTIAAAGPPSPTFSDSSCPSTLTDTASEKVTVTATDRPSTTNPNNDPTTTSGSTAVHYAGLHFSNCSQTGVNTTNSPPTAPDNYCFTQATAGQTLSQTLNYLQDGAPVAGVTVEIDSSGTGAFVAGQPGYVTSTEVDCTTNAQGQCTFTYNHVTAGTSDSFDAFTIANTGLFPSSDAQEQVDFIASSTPGRIVDNNADVVIVPTPQTNAAARPGDAIEKSYTLYSTCTPVSPDTNCYGTPLGNRSVTLTVDHGFFTPNCSLDGKTGTATTNSYDQCSFTPTPAAGTPVGSLTSLGTSVTVTTDSSGNFGATVGIKQDAGFDDDGTVVVKVSGVSTGSSATLVADNGGTSTTSTASCTTNTAANGCPQLTTWSTDNAPLNGGTITFLPVDGNVISADPNNVPDNKTRVYVLHTTDQFGNLTSAADGAPVLAITKTGVGVVRHCGYATTCSANTGALAPFSVYGSYTNADAQDKIISASSPTAGPAVDGTQTVTATWPTPRTVFNTYSPATGPIPAAATYTADTVTQTATLKFNFYNQLAQPVVTFGTTPSNSVAVGTVVTVSATVKDQFGQPIPGQPVSFLLTGPNQSSCNPTSDSTKTTGPDGRAGFTFGCNSPGTASVNIVVSDTSGNRIASGIQNVTFSAVPAAGGPSTVPSISENVGSIIAGQMAFITVRGTPGDSYKVVAANRPSSTFLLAHQGIFAADGTSTFEVHPLNNVVFKATTAAGTSNQVVLSVHTGLNIGAKRKTGGNIHTYVFYGQIYPNNRSQAIFIKTGTTTLGQATRDASGKNWTFVYDGSASAGQRVVFYSFTASDTQNANGHSMNYALKL